MLVALKCLPLCDPMDCSLCPWNSPGKNIGVGCHFLLQEIFPTQGSKPGLLHGRWTLYHLSDQGSSWTYGLMITYFHSFGSLFFLLDPKISFCFFSSSPDSKRGLSILFLPSIPEARVLHTVPLKYVHLHFLKTYASVLIYPSPYLSTKVDFLLFVVILDQSYNHQ